MTWAPVTMRWPEQATAWIGDLSAAKDLAGHELASTAQRLAGLNGLVSTNLGPVGNAAQGAIAAGRAALAAQLGETPACLAVTLFQGSVGQGTGHNRFLSAPNLLEHLGKNWKTPRTADALAGRSTPWRSCSSVPVWTTWPTAWRASMRCCRYRTWCALNAAPGT